MNYIEARAFIDSVSLRGSVLGLETITNLLSLLENPQNSLKFIHIAGTNGKGSVSAYLGEILKNAGYSVGKYISPTLYSYRERIQINGEYISREDFGELTTKVAEAVEEMRRRGMALPTVFEVETAISFLYFQKKKCDYVLLEVGMGGREDATNIVTTTVLSILVSISMDHMEFLGNTLGEIAWNKAGIIKEGIPAVSASQKKEAEMVILQEAEKKNCKLVFTDLSQLKNVEYGLLEQSFQYKDFDQMKIRLAGVHQIENAALALEAVEMLRLQGAVISNEAVKTGLKETKWKGRFSILREKPYFIIDGAHNPDAAQRLAQTVEKVFPDKKKYYIFGVFSDKEYAKIIEITAGLAEHITTVETPGNSRALSAEAAAEAVRKVNPSVHAAASIADAIRDTYEMAGEEDVILAFGSLSHLNEIEQALIRYEENRID